MDNDVRARLNRYLPALGKDLGTATRFCVFNVGEITVKEFWTIIKDRMSPEMLNGVVRAQAVLQPNRRRRIDFWMTAGVASKVKSALYLTPRQRREGTTVCHKYPLRKLSHLWKRTGQTRKWRLDVYREWREREPKKIPEDTLQGPGPPPPDGIMTFNVNGIINKRLEVEHFINMNRMAIVALQETITNGQRDQLCFRGYQVFERRQTKNFRGQALLIHDHYKAYQTGDLTLDFLIHVKIAGYTEGQPSHVLAVYLPSGGNHRSDRTKCFNRVMAEYKEIVAKEPKAKVVILGDTNYKRVDLKK